MSYKIHFVSLLLFILGIILSTHTVLGQVGNYCENDSYCADRLSQICVTHHCTCKSKYVANGTDCFRESRFGEVCFFSEQCNDDRQICAKTAHGLQRCICNMYHQYDKEVAHCVPKHNITELLQERYDVHGLIAKNASSTFFGISIAGMSIAIIGFCCFILAFLYCFRMHKSDTNLNKKVELLNNKYGKNLKDSNDKPSSEDDRKMKEAAVVPMISDDLAL